MHGCAPPHEFGACSGVPLDPPIGDLPSRQVPEAAGGKLRYLFRPLNPMPFLPTEFTIPAVVQTERFRMRSITIHDAFKDYDAVMSSRDHLWSRFGAIWGWPAADLSIEQNIIDLAWHQKEFQLRSSFDYAVMSLDERRLLGCVYIDPPDASGTDADVWFWARQSELSTGLEEQLGEFVASWLASAWPLKKVTLNGQLRDLNPPAAA